jgi:hypothetical protein
VTDPDLPACGPADLEEYAVENEQPDTNPRHDFDFQGLEDELTFLTLPVAVDQTNICTSNVPMSVYLPVRFKQAGADGRRARRSSARRSSAPIPSVVDEDKMKLTCLPAENTSPCDTVTSTFDQIQKTIFTPTSCARSTCHNVRQDPHDMSLSPGEAYANLVGVAPRTSPRTPPASSASIPAIRRTASSWTSSAATSRSPKATRCRSSSAACRPAAIELIEEWIAAGAPETGFVAPSGCPGP